MNDDAHKRLHWILLAGLLAYGAVISAARIDYNSVFVDEACHFGMGREIAAGGDCPGCAAHTGSVMTWPLLAAYADSAGGLFAARALNVVFGLLLGLCIYLATRILFGRWYGLLAAAIFLFSGQALYLMKLATYDMTAALFLGAALLCFVAAGRVESARHEGLALATGTILLSLAAITKYLLPVYIPVCIVYVVLRHGMARCALFVLAPLTVFMLAFFIFSPHPPSPRLIAQIDEVRDASRLPLRTLINWTFRWLALAYLLAAFGLFHERFRRQAAALIVFSAPVIMIHLVTRAEHSVNKNVVFALIFLAPAAALGVDHIVHLFSMREPAAAVRRFFTVSILAVVCVYGVHNLRWLERQHPDVTPVIEFFARNGYDGMTVASNGWDGVLYNYALEKRFPRARFDHISRFIRAEGPRRSLADEVSFVLCQDDYYGKHYPSAHFGDILESDCALLEEFTIRHSWGETHALVYGRKHQ